MYNKEDFGVHLRIMPKRFHDVTDRQLLKSVLQSQCTCVSFSCIQPLTAELAAPAADHLSIGVRADGGQLLTGQSLPQVVHTRVHYRRRCGHLGEA